MEGLTDLGVKFHNRCRAAFRQHRVFAMDLGVVTIDGATVRAWALVMAYEGQRYTILQTDWSNADGGEQSPSAGSGPRLNGDHITYSFGPTKMFLGSLSLDVATWRVDVDGNILPLNVNGANENPKEPFKEAMEELPVSRTLRYGHAVSTL